MPIFSTPASFSLSVTVMKSCTVALASATGPLLGGALVDQLVQVERRGHGDQLAEEHASQAVSAFRRMHEQPYFADVRTPQPRLPFENAVGHDPVVLPGQ